MTLIIFRFLTVGLFLPSLLLLFVDAVKLDAATPKWQKWAPYRPGLYFGVRPNIPDTLLMGLMWANGTDKATLIDTLRDTCEQDDGMASYGWTMYDPRVGGSQSVHDAQLGVNLATDFIKQDDGSGWAVRVTGEVRPGAAEADAVVRTSLVFHVAMEGAVRSPTKSLKCERLGPGKMGHISGAECRGQHDKLGQFDFRINADPKDNVITKSTIRSRRVGESKIWEAKSVFKDMIKLDDNQDAPGAGNFHFVRFDFEGPFSATFSYRDEGGLHISPDAVASKLQELRSSFTTQVNKVFSRTSPFRDERHETFTQGLLSNLLGGLGFFHGDSKADFTRTTEEHLDGTDIDVLFNDRKVMADTKITTTKATSLLSFTPSRPFFPRGFLWDEGFHLLPAIEWDFDLAIDVLRSWLDLMDKDGWIAREQILGPEARSRVPEKFQVQYPHHANPPTFLALTLPAILSKLTAETTYHGHASRYLMPTSASATERKSLLRELYPLLARHHAYFRATQAGNLTITTDAGVYPRPPSAIPTEGYRWRGRTPTHTLASGLDDYPRASPPSPAELHVDALAWVGASARALQRAAEFIGDASTDADAEMYAAQVRDVVHNLDALHWSDHDAAYCDATVSTGGKRYEHVCHVGYVSVLPLLVGGLLNASHPRLPAVLDVLADAGGMWSDYGLRSLSKRDEFYGKDEDYWRGGVWMNINTLAVLRLREVGLESGVETAAVRARALDMAGELRRRVVGAVYKDWASTGFVWEQYDDSTGEGRRTRAFTGWTACVLLLMGLQFGKDGDGGDAVDDAPALEGLFAGKGTGVASGMMSSRTALVSVAVLLCLWVARRRLLKQVGRVAGYWRTRRGSRGGMYEEVLEMDKRDP